MKILVLGGTAWLGRTIAWEAFERGHEVACLARGESGGVPGGIRFVTADRATADAYDAVAHEHWDAILDVSRQPGQVRSAVAALESAAERFIVVSSCSVYADNDEPNADERAQLLEPLQSDEMLTPDEYGHAKVACENAVLDGIGAGRTLIARPGLIGGPGDISDRTGYWPLRFARPSSESGSVLVPDPEGVHAQIIDARDLAAWLVDCAERGTAGIFNATGDAVPFADYLALAAEIGGFTGDMVVASRTWLGEHDVQPWAGERSVPIWLPVPEYSGFSTRTNAAALADGLVLRPLSDTVTDTLDWELSREHGDGMPGRGAGLSDAEERELLSAL